MQTTVPQYRPHDLLHRVVRLLKQDGVDIRVTLDAQDNWTVEADVWVTQPDNTRHRMVLSISDTAS